LLESNMTNTRTPAQLRAALDAIVDELKALDASTLADAELVPLVKSVQSVGAYVSAIDAQIQIRAITNGVMLPGVVVKDAIVHRKWSDVNTASELAFAQFGLKAFTFNGPAAIEKLGDGGKALVAVASYKPEAGKRVVY
jgi:hypothetical protein